MPEQPQTTQDAAGVTRTPEGTIVDQSPQPTSTQPTPQPQPTDKAQSTSSTPQSTEKPKTETKSDGKPQKSLINETGAEEGAPENYAEFKTPEGTALDGEVVAEATALFKKFNLPQAAGQELVDFYIKHTKEAFEAPLNHYADTRAEWRERVNADPEIGGSKLKGTIASIGKLIDSFGSDKVREGFRQAMEYTGAGDHPDVIRGLYELSKHLTEGGAVRGNGPSSLGQRIGGPEQVSTAQAIYPHLPSSNRQG